METRNMTDEQALSLAHKIRKSVEAFGATYATGSYGNIYAEEGSPFRFKMNFLMGGEKFNIELTGNDFDEGPFVEQSPESNNPRCDQCPC